MRGTLRPANGREQYWEIAVDAGRDPITGKRARVVRGVHGGKLDAERALNQLVTDAAADERRRRQSPTCSTAGSTTSA